LNIKLQEWKFPKLNRTLRQGGFTINYKVVDEFRTFLMAEDSDSPLCEDIQKLIAHIQI